MFFRPRADTLTVRQDLLDELSRRADHAFSGRDTLGFSGMTPPAYHRWAGRGYADLVNVVRRHPPRVWERPAAYAGRLRPAFQACHDHYRTLSDDEDGAALGSVTDGLMLLGTLETG